VTSLPTGPRERWLLTAASAGSVVIPFALAPVWSRVYPVEYFSVTAVVQVIPGILANWATLAYHTAIQTPAEEDEAFALMKVALLLCCVVGAAVLGVVLGAGGWIATHLLGEPEVGPWLWAAPVLCTAIAATLTLDQWMIREGRLGRLATSLLITTAFGALPPALGLRNPGRTNYILWGLLSATVAGALIRLGMSGVVPRWRREGQGGPGLREVATRFARFPRDIVPSTLLTGLSTQLPQLMLARHFPQAVVGQYSRAGTILTIPIQVLGKPIAAVFQHQAGRAFRATGDCRAELRVALVQLTLTFVVTYGGIAILAPWLYPWFLGPAWREAGSFAQPLAITYMVMAIGTPLSAVFAISGHTRRDLAWQAFRMVTVLAALAIGVRSADPRTALWWLAGASVTVYLFYAFLAWTTARRATAGPPDGAAAAPPGTAEWTETAVGG
jgi:O-antigen/teichoic acid export membrane protein